MNNPLRAIALLLLCMPAMPDAYGIANGAKVSDAKFSSDYPWAVVIVNTLNGGLCGGALIESRLVITAAHCTGINKYVLVENADRSKARRVEVENAVRHPDFDSTTLQFDVGLLYLAEPVEMKPIPLASETESRVLVQPGSNAVIAGWGKTPANRPQSERLVEGWATLRGLSKRGSQYIYDDPNTGPCGYDSGGPMVVMTLDGRRLLAGVASATDGNLCGKGGGIAVYTNLSYVSNFIDEQLARFAIR